MEEERLMKNKKVVQVQYNIGINIVLVHGACHGAWSWYKVATLLRAAGHNVTVPDLAASGIHPTHLQDVTTFHAYSQPLLDIMASLPPREKVILVGHSLGGLTVALAADKFPDKVAAVVFVAAFMPDCNSHPSYVIDKYIQQVPSSGPSGWMDTEFGFVGVNAERPLTSMRFGPQFMACKLYQLCSPQDLTLATTLLRTGSMFIEDLQTAPAFSKDRYGSVFSVYIVCREDAAISEDFQRWMIQNHPVQEVLEIEGADHMAMLSTPHDLCQSLLHIADSFRAL